MQSVGKRLREARERNGFSLDEINAKTRISPKNLIALEADDVSSICSPFFYRSYVRQYAEQVSLDFEILASDVELLTQRMPQPILPGQGDFQPVRTAPIQARPKRDFSWVAPALTFVGLVLCGSAGFAAWTYYRPLLHAQAHAAQPLAIAPKPIPKPAVPESAAVTTPANEKIHLELAASEPTWLAVSADGKPAYTGILQPAQTKVLDSEQSAQVRAGNAGGVTIRFNGKEIGPIGPRGKTRTVVFTRTGFQVRAPGQLIASSRIGG